MKAILATIIATVVLAPAVFASDAKPCDKAKEACNKDKAAACDSAKKVCPKSRAALLTHKGNSLAKR